MQKLGTGNQVAIKIKKIKNKKGGGERNQDERSKLRTRMSLASPLINLVENCSFKHGDRPTTWQLEAASLISFKTFPSCQKQWLQGLGALSQVKLVIPRFLDPSTVYASRTWMQARLHWSSSDSLTHNVCNKDLDAD